MSKKISLEKLKEVFESKDFKNELEAVSSYAANNKQEIHIIHILAKFFDQEGFIVVPEYKKKPKDVQRYDLMINEAIIESKFFFESDLIYLDKEFKKNQNYLENLMNLLNTLIKNKGPIFRDISLPILKDIFKKIPDFFILIIQSRDFIDLQDNKDALKFVC